jgi:2-amino-4-hydroxy-6-hydroxymethyldihydropteridine diphosphokinase
MIAIGLGSNLGERDDNIHQAIQQLAANPKITLLKQSSLYNTSPVSHIPQPDFLNAVILIETTLSPEELLQTCLTIENQLGRIRQERWGPRVIDLDLLFFHDYQSSTETLILPHPYFHQRAFVLIPLSEIAGSSPIYHGFTAEQLLAQLPSAGVEKFLAYNKGISIREKVK